MCILLNNFGQKNKFVLIFFLNFLNISQYLFNFFHLAERIDLIKTLNVKVEGLWSAMEICDAWALARGFLTAKAGRPDTNRAANHILRMTLSGQIILTLLPPGFVAKEDAWQAHEGISDVEAIKALGISEDLVEVDENYESDSENDDGIS